MTTLAHDVAKKIVGVEDIFYQLKREHIKQRFNFILNLKIGWERGK